MKTLQQRNKIEDRFDLNSIADRTSIWTESRYKTTTGGEQVIKFPMTDEPKELANNKFQRK